MDHDTQSQRADSHESLKSRVGNMVRSTEVGYRLDLARQTGSLCPHGQPTIVSRSGALKSRAEWERAVREVESLGLPKHVDLPKNWDSLMALQWILQYVDKEAPVLDGGAEVYSVILPWLFLYGYKHLTGINLTFEDLVHRGSIRYQFGDITRTPFKSGSFGAITCLSVIEHGVNLEAYFWEASRLLRPGGLLITSTDYYPQRIDTTGKQAYDCPVVIFSRQDVEAMLETARAFGLAPVDEVDFDCQEKPVRWESQDLDYSFIVFCLRKWPT